jgi:transposase
MSCPEAFKDHSKKKSFLYTERDEDQRETFLERLKEIAPSRLVWVDECGVEENLERTYARSPKGQRAHADISGKKAHNRTTIIAAYICKTLKAPFRFKGYTNTTVFDAWVEKCLVPVLVAGQIVILDNAAFHKAQSIIDKIEAVGAKVLFLPPYSPDINKIEPQWAVLKSKLKKDKYRYSDFLHNLDTQLISMGNYSVN